MSCEQSDIRMIYGVQNKKIMPLNCASIVSKDTLDVLQPIAFFVEERKTISQVSYSYLQKIEVSLS